MPAAAEAPRQLDLFIDGRDAILVHEVVSALVARDAARVAAALAQLASEHPAHPDLPALTFLASTRGAPPPSQPTHAELAARIDEIERRVAPAARRYLGAADAVAFLGPLWRALAASAESMPFDEAHPRAHAGWLWQQYGDWAAVRAAIDAERDWAARPLLRLWMGLAHHHLGESEAALRLWLPVCWMDPALFAGFAPGLPSAPVREAWTRVRARRLLRRRPGQRVRRRSLVSRLAPRAPPGPGPALRGRRRFRYGPPRARVRRAALAPAPGGRRLDRRTGPRAPRPPADQPRVLPRLSRGREPPASRSRGPGRSGALMTDVGWRTRPSRRSR